MDLIIKKLDKSKMIRSMFSAIKRDNLEKFQDIIAQYPDFLYFKNHRRENILFYAFDNNSKKIIDFIHACEPGFIQEKNIRNLNILHELILGNKDIDYFLEGMNHWEDSSVQKLYNNNDPQGNNLILMAAKSGNIDVLRKIINQCPSFETLQKHSNIYGQNIAHFMASNIFTDCNDIVNKLAPELLKNIDNINGFTPLMLAAYHQKINNFNEFLKIYPKEQTSLLGNNLIHFAAHNPDNGVVKLLISNGLYTSKKNLAEQSPLLIALSKGHDKVANTLFEKAKDEVIYQEDVVNAIKISNKNWDLFKEIINNPKNEDLSETNIKNFLEGLFLIGKYDAIQEVEKNDKYKNYFESASIVNLFSKTIIGKRDMSLKTYFLLQNKEFLTKEETIGIVNSLEKIPANQVRFLLQSTDVITKSLEENRVLFGALCLEKGLNYNDFGIKLSINEDEDIQRAIRKSLRSVKIEESKKHYHNIESWLSLLADEKVVWKHYGRIISKNIDPFAFLEEKFEFLSRQSKKELVYYAITALFKDEKEIPETTFKSIEAHPNLLSNVFIGIMKVGKVPANKQLLGVLPQIKDKILNTNDFVNILKKSSKSRKQAISVLKDNINMFDFNVVDDMAELCNNLINNPFHYEIMEEVVLALNSSSKENLMYAYIDSYISQPSATINIEVLEQLILSYDNPIEVVNYTFRKTLEDPTFNNIEFITRIKNLVSENILPDLTQMQNLINNEDFNTCVKLLQIGKSELPLRKIDLNSIDWESIDRQVITMDKQNKFFEFISNGKDLFTEKQINILTHNLVNKAKSNIIAFQTIDKFLTALDKNVHKIEDDLLCELSVNILDKQSFKDMITRFMSQESFNSIFNSISENKDGHFFERIRDNKNFNLIPKETRIAIDKEILEDTLIVNKSDAPKTKKMKL
jgi:hypothetical protein